MTEKLKPCPAGHPYAYIVSKGLSPTETAYHGECACGWQSPIKIQSKEAAIEKWNTRAESEVYGNGWAVKTKWNSVPHIFHDQREAERFAYDEKAEVVRVKIVRDE